MLKSVKEEKYFFTQKIHHVWQDYFYPQQEHIHFFSKHSAHEKLNCYIKAQDTWWDTAFAGVDIRKLFITEFFEAFLRIYTTPWTLIEKMADEIIGHQFRKERQKFLKFLENKLSQFLDQFENFLSLQEQVKWKQFLSTQGLQKFSQFNHDFDEFFQHYPYLDASGQKEQKDLMLAYALNMGIPNLESYLSRDKIAGYIRQTQAYAYLYIRENVDKQFHLLRGNPHHPLWVCLQEFGAGMEHFNAEINIESTPENLYLLSKCIQYHFYYLSRFLLIQNPFLKNDINTLNFSDDINDDKIKNRSIFFISLISANKESVHLLKSLHAKLKEDEIPEMQKIIWECIQYNNKDLFKFILRYYPDILDDVTEDFISFRSRLETHCVAFAPEFSALIPPVYRPTFRFFPKIHVRFDASSSESEDEIDESPYGFSAGSKV